MEGSEFFVFPHNNLFFSNASIQIKHPELEISLGYLPNYLFKRKKKKKRKFTTGFGNTKIAIIPFLISKSTNLICADL